MKYLWLLTSLFITIMTVDIAVAETNSNVDMTQIKEVLAGDDVSALDKLIAQSIDVNQRDEDGNTLLLYALNNNDDLTMARQLIIAGADVNAPSAQTGITPFIIATSMANTLQQQAQNIKADGKTTIDDDDLKKFMLKQMNKAIEITKMLIEYGANINQETPFGTPLMDAAKNEWNEAIIKLLLENGAKINLQDRLGRTALFYAEAFNCNKNLSLLLAAGADVEITDIEGKSYMEANPKDFLE